VQALASAPSATDSHPAWLLASAMRAIGRCQTRRVNWRLMVSRLAL
jgi:hypothetical protein